jgi:AbiTii
MSKSDPGLLAELKAGLRNGKTSTADLLNQCILLGGEVGSECLRDWAGKELKGYGDGETLPDYRRVAASLCIDGYVPGGYITGEAISVLSLPEWARDKISEDAPFPHALAQLEDLSRRRDETVNLQVPGAQELIVLWNHETGNHVTRLYWQVSRSAVVGVVAGVRIALTELVAEMLAAAPGGHQPPSREAADNAVHLVVTGNRNTVTVVGSQMAAAGPATITVTGSTEQPGAEDDTWWQRWRKRGLIIGLATVVAAVVAVLQLVGWVPWKHADPPVHHSSGHAAHSAAAVHASPSNRLLW